jgi:type IV secretory pathway VirJ component
MNSSLKRRYLIFVLSFALLYVLGVMPAARGNSAVPNSLQDLPITEVPAASLGKDVFAVMVSGDGGWAQLDRGLSAEMAHRGIPVAGLNSLRYFWQERTPQQTADDLGRIIEHYSAQWQRPRVLLIGYSFGADVMPAVFNRLAPVSRARVASISLLGLAQRATYEVSAAEWIPALARKGELVLPDVRKISAMPMLCVEGAGEIHSICPELQQLGIQVRQIGKRHHFSYREAEIADAVLSVARIEDGAGKWFPGFVRKGDS